MVEFFNNPGSFCRRKSQIQKTIAAKQTSLDSATVELEKEILGNKLVLPLVK